jgi:hypothetical protein
MATVDQVMVLFWVPAPHSSKMFRRFGERHDYLNEAQFCNPREHSAKFCASVNLKPDKD